MKISDISIKRPVFAVMMVSIFVVLGIFGYFTLAVDLYPNIQFPIVTVTTTLPGASPKEMELDVTKKIEDAVNSVSGIKHIMSTSSVGQSSVIVEFHLNKNIDHRYEVVTADVDAILDTLPKNINTPVIKKLNVNSSPILWITLSGNRSKRFLTFYAEKVLQRKFERLSGVGQVIVSGARNRRMVFNINNNKLISHNLGVNQIINAIESQSVAMPTGNLKTNTKTYFTYLKGRLHSSKAFNNMIINNINGVPVKFSQIGLAKNYEAPAVSITTFDGKPAVGLGITIKTHANAVKVASESINYLNEIKYSFPPGVHASVAYNSATYIERSISGVEFDIIWGALLTVLIVFFFLKDIRTTLIAAISLPAAIISTFGFMHLMGFALNNMTMLGLSLSVGLLIDDAIVVIENIFRHVENGEERVSASFNSMSEIGIAIMATTLSIVAVFIPVAFMPGMIGKFFYEFGLTVAFAVLVSLFVSFTLTPMLASRFIVHKKDHGMLFTILENMMIKITHIYKGMIAWSLKHRLLVILTALLIFIGSLYMTKFIGKEMMPPSNSGNFLVYFQAPEGTSVRVMKKYSTKLYKIVQKTPFLKSIFMATGFGANGSRYKGMFFVAIKSNRNLNQQQVMGILRKKLAIVPGVITQVMDMPNVGGASQNVAPLQVIVMGPNLHKITAYSNELINKLRKTHGLVDITSNMQFHQPELLIHIRRNIAGSLGVSVASIGETIDALIGGDINIFKNYNFVYENHIYNQQIRLFRNERNKPGDIKNLYVSNNKGKLIPLRDLITIKKTIGPQVINRRDLENSVTVYADMANHVPLGFGIKKAAEYMKQILPKKSLYTYEFSGMASKQQQSFASMGGALLLALIIVYMILASLFDSFVDPLVIMLSVPLALIGAIGALYLAHRNLSVIALIGIILLLGLVVKNAILLVDYTIILIKERNYKRNDAIIEAGSVRLRPILMTTMAMVFGMLPIALGTGVGASSRAPMGIDVIGGLLTSMFLTLIVVPVVYSLVDDLKKKVRRNK
ncbi:MAG: efflux RND transporter permease subunit [Candidatus Acididesulfobacter diazotrophicus]|jgi:HAE1 family hydrophobic/amphiphilic exporter-1|uniref:Efflux RND transporter permease subunit n=1 Tax=Candidatus Acididesulfobacter diazotrophicus TaxID=2597226 RepID=A0A519BNN9_9DELT|nr:MAG: efflux RND transporter permease subunit [Candidatus Acididesulfobacter diazotrophicus]